MTIVSWAPTNACSRDKLNLHNYFPKVLKHFTWKQFLINSFKVCWNLAETIFLHFYVLIKTVIFGTRIQGDKKQWKKGEINLESLSDWLAHKLLALSNRSNWIENSFVYVFLSIFFLVASTFYLSLMSVQTMLQICFNLQRKVVL